MRYNKLIFFCLFVGLTTQSDTLTAQPAPFSTLIAYGNQNKSGPSGEMLGKLNEAGVDLFSGSPTFRLPLYTIQGENMSYDIGISYATSGIKVNEKPTWVGLGWNLDGEAQIVRRVNHIHDETFSVAFKHSGVALDQGYYYRGSQFNTANWLSTAFLNDAINSALAGHAQTVGRVVLDGEPDEFMFNFEGYSGSFYRTEKGTWAVKSKQNVSIKIEEEVHTWGHNNVNSAYYFTPSDVHSSSSLKPSVATLFTKFTLTTPNGYQYTFGGDESALEISRNILPLFGQLGANTSKAIPEYYTVNTWKLTKIRAPFGEEINFTYQRGKLLYDRDRTYIQGSKFAGGVDNMSMNGTQNATLNYNVAVIYPTYLSAIETKKSVLTFVKSQSTEQNYNRLPPLPGWATYYIGAAPTDPLGNPYSEYLLMDYSLKEDRGYDYARPGTNSPENAFRWYGQQLDSIKLFDKVSQKNVDGIKFNQSSDATTRRTLNGLFRFNFKDNNTAGNYTFEYDDVANMKKYESLAKDPWGYQSTENNEFKINGYDRLSLDYTAVDFPSRQSAYATKGMLKKINNPFGGSTEFQYEPNVYSASLKGNLQTNLVDLVSTGNLTGSGVRVASISHKDYLGAPAKVTLYKYLYDPLGNGTTSSGILNFDFTDDVLSAYNCANGTYPLTILEYGTDMYQERLRRFRGGIITYSKVKEIKSDGSFTVYNYANSDDPQYRDEMHLKYVNVNIISQKDYRLSTMELERGNLLKTSMYAANGTLVKEITNTYRNDPGRKNEYIKAMAHKTTFQAGRYANIQCGGAVAPSLKKRLWAYKIYTYKNPLVKTTETDFYVDAPAMVKTIEYSYDAFGNVVTTKTTSSEGSTIVKSVKYNSHNDYSNYALGGDATSAGIWKLKAMYGIHTYPVETFVTETYVSGGMIPPPSYLNAELNIYNTYSPVPDKKMILRTTLPLDEGSVFNTSGFYSSRINSASNFEKDSRYVLEEDVITRTTSAALSVPKPTTINDRKSGLNAITWDYKGLFLSSKTTNAHQSEIAFSGFEGTYSGNLATFKNGWSFDENKISSGYNAFTGSSSLQASLATGFSAANTFIKSNPLPGLPYRISFWANSSTGLYLAVGNNLNLLQPKKNGFGSWKYYEAEFTPVYENRVGLLLYGNSAPVYIDELMLLPAHAQMESYSYETGTDKMTSYNTGSGVVLFYEFDGLGRLIAEKDEAGNIIKTHTHKLQSY